MIHLMRLIGVALLAAMACACGQEDREPGELMSGELTGRLGGDPFPVRYGVLRDWDGDWGARLSFTDLPWGCDGGGDDYPQFHAGMDLATDPESDQDWNGAHHITQNSPRIVLEFDSGQLHLERVEDDSVSGTLSWGGPREEYDEVFSLEGTFQVERCYREYPGD